MPARMQGCDITHHRTTAPTGSPQDRTLTMVIPGSSVGGDITLRAQPLGGDSLLTHLLRRGSVGVVNRSGLFTHQGEGIAIVDWLDYELGFGDFDRLVLIGHSMGGRSATAVIDELRRRGVARSLEGSNGLVMACFSSWDGQDYKPRRAMAALSHIQCWPPRWNLWLGPRLDRLGPQYVHDAGTEELEAENRRFMNLCPNPDRRSQLHAMLHSEPVPAGHYAGIRLACLVAGIDPFVLPTFADKYIQAFGDGQTVPCPGCFHGAWVEQPTMWFPHILGTLDTHGYTPHA